MSFVVGFRFFLFSVVTTLWLRSVKNAMWPIAGIMLSASIGVFFELSQFIVVSRAPSVQDLVVIFIGCILGGLFVLIIPKKIAAIIWVLPIIIITTITAAVQNVGTL